MGEKGKQIAGEDGEEAVISKYSFSDGKVCAPLSVTKCLPSLPHPPLDSTDSHNSRQPIQFNLCLIGGNRSDYLS